MNYSLEKYDFRNYLLETLKDTRQEELIFWKNTIPMPVDLIYNIFEKRGILFKKYIDHIGAACLYGYSIKKEGGKWLDQLAQQPTDKNIPNKIALTTLLKKHLGPSMVVDMLQKLAETLLLNDYNTNEETLVESLCHDGRKYKRLYIPPLLKSIVREDFPDVLECISLSNNDMFSNVVADELNIYRMGFADAFSGIFNKLIDFILDHSGSNKNYSSASAYIVSDDTRGLAQDAPAHFGRVSDGSMWEPVYSSSRTGYLINSHHPFVEWSRAKGPDAEEIFTRMIGEMARLENEMLKESERNIIERFRHDLSRNLRLETEAIHSLPSKA
jgi:hypothetical protein